MESEISCIQRLTDAESYAMWRFQLDIFLKAAGLYEIADGTTTLAAQTTDPLKEAFKLKDAKVQKYITCTVSRVALSHVLTCASGKEMYDKLIEVYEKDNDQQKYLLTQKYYDFKFNSNMDAMSNISELQCIVHKLKSLNQNISDELIMVKILNILPTTFSIFRTAWDSTPTNEKTLKNLISRIQLEETRMKTDNEQHVQAAFYTKICYNCKKPGHIRRDCRQAQNIRHFNESKGRNYENRGDFAQGDRNGNKFQFTKGHSSGNQNRGYQNQGSGNGRNYKASPNQGYSRGNQQRGSYLQHQEQSHPSSGMYPHRNANACSRDYEVQEDEDSRNEESVTFMANTSQSNSEVSVSKPTVIFKADSGCTDHMVNDKSDFYSYELVASPLKIRVAKSNQSMDVKGIGTVKVVSYVNGVPITCNITQVLHVPELERNLLSIKKLDKLGIRAIFDNGVLLQEKATNEIVAQGVLNNLYDLKFELIRPECNLTETQNKNSTLWHKRFGHIGNIGLEKLVKHKMVEGIDENLKIERNSFCEPCVSGKMCRLPFHTRRKSSRLLEIVHSDVCGPIDPVSYDGYKYFVTFIDDYSHFVVVYLLTHKSEVLKCFREYVQMTESKFNVRMAKLRCDNGGEYSSKEFIEFCKLKGIVIDYTVPYTPELDGSAERMNRTLIEKARAMFCESLVPKSFWSEAILNVAYILNRSPTAAIAEQVTPAELWYGYKPDVSNLRVFGCVAYSHIPKALRKKLDYKTEKCVMMGYAQNGYRLYNEQKGKVIISRDVKFNENMYFYETDIRQFLNDSENVMVTDMKQTVENPENTEDVIEDEQNVENLGTRPTRVRNAPKKLDDYELYLAYEATSFVDDAPLSFEEIKDRYDRESWEKAIEAEIQSIEDNDTWVLVSKPESEKILDTKWVFAFKDLEDGQDRFKARLVVRGFAQTNVNPYRDIYSPVAKLATVRTLLSVGNQQDYHFLQLDVKTAFLNGELETPVYVYPPPGLEHVRGQVYKLKKALYGLKNAAKCWNKKINNVLIQMGFNKSENDPCLYIRTKESELIYLLIFVDDIILSGKNLDDLLTVKNVLMSNFKMKDKGDLKNFLGLEITRDRDKGELKISQTRYCEKIIDRFGFESCVPSNLPIEPRLSIKPEGSLTEFPYRELIGSLMYLMIGTRPDISFAVNYFSKFQENPTTEIWNHLTKILRYLKKTKHFSLIYTKGNESLIGYSDASWGSDIHDSRSVSGYLFKINSNIVSWATKRQQTTALSTAEAELISLTTAVCEGLWLRKLLCDFGFCLPLIVHEDNNACLSIANNPGNIRRVKHINLKYQFISEKISEGIVELKYVPTHEQLADGFTKGLPSIKFKNFIKMLSLV